MTGFRKVDIWGTGELRIIQDKEESLEITCDDNFLDKIKTDVRGNVLHIGPDHARLKPTKTIEYVLRLKDLEAIQSAGALSIQAETLNCSQLSITANGVCSVNLGALQADAITTTINGAVKVTVVSGKVKQQTVTMNGAGHYQCPNVDAEATTVTINGTGQATVWASGTLKANLHGTGSISYYGSPKVSQSVAGLGRIRSLGEK